MANRRQFLKNLFLAPMILSGIKETQPDFYYSNDPIESDFSKSLKPEYLFTTTQGGKYNTASGYVFKIE
jgi:hypothetical protein